MLLVSLFRITKFAFQNFFRNIWLSVVTITIVVMSLFVMTMLVALNVVVTDTVTSLQKKIDISVYFKQETVLEDVVKIRDNLQQLAVVDSVELVTRQQALENFQARYTNNPVIAQSLEALDNNPLGDILIIKASSIEQYKSILDLLSQEELDQFIQESDFSDFESIIDRITTVSQKVNQIGIGVSAFFIFISLLIVFNTIRMAIYTHKEEIAIMRLVGASGSFIRAPFLLEGLLYAIIAISINIAVLYPILDAIQPFVGGFFGEESLNLVTYFTDNFWIIFGGEFLIILILILLSSWIAIRKYIRI